jgi:hypothetical protein
MSAARRYVLLSRTRALFSPVSFPAMVSEGLKCRM